MVAHSRDEQVREELVDLHRQAAADGMVKIALPMDEGGIEWCYGKRLSATRARMVNVPVFCSGVRYGDVVEFGEQDEPSEFFKVFVSVVEQHSFTVPFRVSCESKATPADSRLRRQAVVDALQALPEADRPEMYEWVAGELIVMAWPLTADESRVDGVLRMLRNLVRGWKADADLVEVLEYAMCQGAESSELLRGVRTEWNWSCCQPCGVSELREAFEAGECEDADYAFCHAQDVAGIGKYGHCHVAYGSFAPDGDAAAIGRAVEAALREVGLVVEWTGNASDRLCVWLDRRAVSARKNNG